MDRITQLQQVFDSVSKEELLQFFQSQAYTNESLALALIEAYWHPAEKDYSALVEQCFAHPAVSKQGFGRLYSWTAIMKDTRALMNKVQDLYESGDALSAVEIAQLFLFKACDTYMSDCGHIVLSIGNTYDYIRSFVKDIDCAKEILVRALVQDDLIDEYTQQGLAKELIEQLKPLKQAPFLEAAKLTEDLKPRAFSAKRYLTYINKKIESVYNSYDQEKFIQRKVEFLKRQNNHEEVVQTYERWLKTGEVRAAYANYLIERENYTRALEVMDITMDDCYYYSNNFDEQTKQVLDKLGDQQFTIKWLRHRFYRTERKQKFYEWLKEAIPASEWKAFIDEILKEADVAFKHDFDDIEAQIYVERKEYDRLMDYFRRQTYNLDNNLVNYGHYLSEDHQAELIDLIVENTKRRAPECKRSKEYAFMVARWCKLLQICPKVARRKLNEMMHWFSQNNLQRVNNYLGKL